MIAVTWSRRAIKHLKAIKRYIEKFNPGAAQSTAEKILESVETISNHPLIGRIEEIDDQTRRFSVPGTSYIIFYQVRDVVEIAAVLHGAQMLDVSDD